MGFLGGFDEFREAESASPLEQQLPAGGEPRVVLSVNLCKCPEQHGARDGLNTSVWSERGSEPELRLQEREWDERVPVCCLRGCQQRAEEAAGQAWSCRCPRPWAGAHALRPQV